MAEALGTPPVLYDSTIAPGLRPQTRIPPYEINTGVGLSALYAVD